MRWQMPQVASTSTCSSIARRQESGPATPQRDEQHRWAPAPAPTPSDGEALDTLPELHPEVGAK